MLKAVTWKSKAKNITTSFLHGIYYKAIENSPSLKEDIAFYKRLRKNHQDYEKVRTYEWLRTVVEEELERRIEKQSECMAELQAERDGLWKDGIDKDASIN